MQRPGGMLHLKSKIFRKMFFVYLCRPDYPAWVARAARCHGPVGLCRVRAN